MTRSRTMSALTTVATLPLALALGVATAPAAEAAVDIGSFSGGFTSTCTLPEGPEGPISGPYTCDHKATSVACAAVADSGAVTAYAKLCKADLTSGKTRGAATPRPSFWYGWSCANGSGTGTVNYQPSTAEALVFAIPVNLVVAGEHIVISGSYTQAGTGRHVVVRAQIPAICAWNTVVPTGYDGTVAPV